MKKSGSVSNLSSVFSRRAVVLLIACAACFFAASVLLRAYGVGPVSPGKRFGPGSHSVSAIGHAGFYDLLRRMGLPVSRSAGNAVAALGTQGTLIVAEPDSSAAEAGEPGFIRAPRLLLVLPKWRGVPDGLRPEWISKAELVPLSEARQVLSLVGVGGGGEGSVFRRSLTDAEKTAWPVNELGVQPALPDAAQLIRPEEMIPLVGGGDGILLGEVRDSGGQKIWVLSDPDVLSNHGLVKGGNGAFVLAAVNALRSWGSADPTAPVLFDETVHGFREPQGSPLQLLFLFPFAVVTALTCAAAALLVWSGAGRFGVPAAPRPALGFGKANLIGNSARLLDYAGHHAPVLQRYIRMTLRSAANALRAPRFNDLESGDSESGDSALSAWLDSIGKSRGVKTSSADFLEVLRTERDIPRLFESAKKVYDWKQEILDERF